MMENTYGAFIERGKIVETQANRYRVESLSRTGVKTPAIPALPGAAYAVDDLVYFFMFDDGRGLIIAAFT